MKKIAILIVFFTLSCTKDNNDKIITDKIINDKIITKYCQIMCDFKHNIDYTTDVRNRFKADSIFNHVVYSWNKLSKLKKENSKVNFNQINIKSCDCKKINNETK